ncbi:hypothetical protein HK102_009095, partial [Quaeritorhiza haematococci]
HDRESGREPPPATTGEDLARLEALAWQVLAPLRCGDVWMARCLALAKLWEPDYVEALIYRVAGKLKQPGAGVMPESYGVRTLRNWLAEGGPPDLSPKAAALKAKPLTDHQRKIAKHVEIAFGPQGDEEDEDGEDEDRGEAMDQAAAQPADVTEAEADLASRATLRKAISWWRDQLPAILDAIAEERGSNLARETIPAEADLYADQDSAAAASRPWAYAAGASGSGPAEVGGVASMWDSSDRDGRPGNGGGAGP